MNSCGGFSQATICFFIHKGGVFALHQSVKVLVKLFQKLAGLGSAHKKRRFLFAKLFLCASRAKEKAVLRILVYVKAGKKTF